MPLKVVCLWRSLLNNYLPVHVRTIEKLRCKIWNYWQIIIFISNQEKQQQPRTRKNTLLVSITVIHKVEGGSKSVCRIQRNLPRLQRQG